MTFLALHGFTQRGAMWAGVAAQVGGEWRTPDLPGHGGRPAVTWAEAVGLCGGWLAVTAPPRTLVGYSMGGRLALAAALAHGNLVDRLVVLSAGPGIADAAERQRRAADDRALATRLEEAGVAAFLEAWLARPWFGEGQVPPAEWRAAEKVARAGSTASGLAGALRLLGQGAQPYLGDRLGELRMPVLFAAGDGDGRYAALAGAMGERVANSRVVVLPGAGHALVGQQPGEVAALLSAFAGAA